MNVLKKNEFKKRVKSMGEECLKNIQIKFERKRTIGQGTSSRAEFGLELAGRVWARLGLLEGRPRPHP